MLPTVEEQPKKQNDLKFRKFELFNVRLDFLKEQTYSNDFLHKDADVNQSIKSITIGNKTEQFLPEIFEKKLPIAEQSLLNFDQISPQFLKKPSTNSEFHDPEMVQMTVSKFISRLKEGSLNRKIPLNLTEVGCNIIGDKSHFIVERVENIRKFFTSLSILLWMQKIMRKFFESSALIIHPYQNFKIFWDFIQFNLMIFFFFFIPLDLSFEFSESKNIRISLSVIMLFDNFLGFSTAYFHHGKIITERKKIFKTYVPYFFLDLLTQFSLVYDIFNQSNDDGTKVKFIKLIFLIQYHKFQQIYQTLVDRFKIDMKLGYGMDLINLIVTSICIMHYVACFWYVLAIDYPQETSWLNIQYIYEKQPYEQYLYALYWSAVTMMTVGYGDICPQNTVEVTFVIVIVIFGCGMFAYYINKIGMLLQEINKDSMIYKNSLKIINGLMEKNSIEMDLRMRIKEYLRYSWKEEKTQCDEEEFKILSYLPTHLRQELLLSSYGSILIDNPLFFQNFSRKCLSDTVCQGFLRQIRFAPGDIIFEEDEIQENPAIYFITKGEVEIFHKKSIRSNEEVSLCTLKKGNHFGEIAFFSANKRTAGAKALDFTTVFVLNRLDFLNILQNNSDDYEKFHMLKDQINLNFTLLGLRVRCFACRERGHLVNDCKLLHFNPDKEKIIKSNDFSRIQERTKFHRKISKKTKVKIFKALIPMLNNVVDPDLDEPEDSLDDGEEAEDDDPEKKNKKIFFNKETFKDTQTSKYLSQDLDLQNESSTSIPINPFDLSNNNKDNQPINNIHLNGPNLHKNLQITQASSLTNIQMPILQKPVIQMPIKLEKLKRGSKFVENNIIINSPNEMLSTNNNNDKLASSQKRVSFKNNQPICESRSTNKSMILQSALNSVCFPRVSSSGTNSLSDSGKKIESQEGALDLKMSVENFDAITHFKKYFPLNNFKSIQRNLNKKTSIVKILRKKRKEIEKLSQYMFAAVTVRSKLKKMSKKSSNSRIDEKKKNSKNDTIIKKENLMSLVSRVVKSMKKEKSLRKKWYFPVWKLLNIKKK